MPAPRYLLAHSMGGCIGLRAMVERPEFDGRGLLGADVGVEHSGRDPRARRDQLGRSRARFGLGTGRCPAPAAPVASAAVRGNMLTSDRRPSAGVMRQIVAHPELALGGPSIAWTGGRFGRARL